LRQFDAPAVKNALETFDAKFRIEGFMNPGLRPRAKLDKPMIGCAATAKVSAMPQESPKFPMRSRRASRPEPLSIRRTRYGILTAIQS
jgi:hypothetical protein